MRMVLLPIIVLLLGGFSCRTAGLEVRPETAAGTLAFRFGASGRANGPSVNGISVFEVDQDRRGKTVCRLDRLTRVGTVELAVWKYGERLAGYDLQGCGPLEIGRKYGVTIVGPYGSGVAFFVLDETGSVKRIGP